jgi:hypothetical protein
VWPAGFVGQVRSGEHSGHLERWPLSNTGQASIEGLANIGMQPTAARVRMSAAAADAQR